MADTPRSPRVEACIQNAMQKYGGGSPRRDLTYSQNVHQDLAPLARELENALLSANARIVQLEQALASRPAEVELGCGGSGKSGVGNLPCLGCVNCPSEDNYVQQDDAKRLMFAMQDIDGFVSINQDKYDLAVVVMEERGLDEPDWECELEGVRRLIDKAMAAPSHTTNKEK